MGAQPGRKANLASKVLTCVIVAGVIRVVQAERDADAAIKARFARGVEFHHERQAERVGQPVMQSAQRRERMRERMGRAEILLKRDRAHRRRDQHLAARIEVVAVAHRARQRLDR